MKIFAVGSNLWSGHLNHSLASNLNSLVLAMVVDGNGNDDERVVIMFKLLLLNQGNVWSGHFFVIKLIDESRMLLEVLEPFLTPTLGSVDLI